MERIVRACCLWALFTLPTGIRGQESHYRHEFSVAGNITWCDSYGLESSYHYMPFRYAGIGVAVGSWRSFDDGPTLLEDWYGDTNGYGYSNFQFYIKPSFLFRTPSLFHIRRWEFGLHCRPALYIGTSPQLCYMTLMPDGSTERMDYRSDCLAWEGAFGLEVRSGRGILSLGYTLSNLDINREYHFDSFGNYVMKKRPVQGLYIGISFLL